MTYWISKIMKTCLILCYQQLGDRLGVTRDYNDNLKRTTNLYDFIYLNAFRLNL